MQVTSLNEGTYTRIYQSAMSLLVIDFTYLEGWDCELMVKELAAVGSQSNRVSSYIFKRPYGWEKVPMFKARINEAIDNGCNWNDGDVPYSELETLLHREASPAFAIYYYGPLKIKFISGLIDHRVIDISLLEFPELADVILAAIGCTFACHKNSKHGCALRMAYSLAQWLNFYTLSVQHKKCTPQHAFH